MSIDRSVDSRAAVVRGRFRTASLGLSLIALALACAEPEPSDRGPETATVGPTPLESYVAAPDDAYEFEVVDTIEGPGFTFHVIRMTSQRWLTTAEVDDPLWWHWLTVVVPDEVQGDIGALFLGAGKRSTERPDRPDEVLVRVALATRSVVASLHNVPNQPLLFAGDDYGPRSEDELIAYGWRRFLEAGARDEDSRWLARLPMTKAAVRAMDTVSAVCAEQAGLAVDRFVVSGSSKRGWTSWTTAVVDPRVVAITPIVIDLLNLEPSFEHHFTAYGAWSSAVDAYEGEGVMEWQGTAEYRRLLEIVEPYSYRERLTLPKFVVNATGDSLFLPDSWRFYWDGLAGEKHLRYLPNTDHFTRDTDMLESLVAFYHAVRTDTPRPSYDWRVEGGVIHLTTDPADPPSAVTLWRASNREARDFRLETTGEIWQAEPVEPSADGRYLLSVEAPAEGWTAFFVELTFPGTAPVPYKFTSGVVVMPETMPHAPYVSPRRGG